MILDGMADERTQTALDVAWLRAELRPVSPYGVRAFAETVPFVPGEENRASEAARHVAQLAAACDRGLLDALRGALAEAPDVAGVVARLSVGASLDDAEFLELLRFADAYVRARDSSACIEGLGPGANAAVDGVRADLEPGRSGKFGFYLSDAYDGALGAARASAAQAQARYDGERERRLAEVAAALARPALEEDEFVLMRDDLRGPLPPGVRVLRESPAYLSCEVELDPAALAARAELEAQAGAVARAEESVRADLSQRLRPRAAGLSAAMHALGELDVRIAKVAFCLTHAGVAAEVVAQAELTFQDARFLPVAESVAQHGERYAPVSMSLRGAAVLTGPNMGGKSVALRTCGALALLAALGIPVPAAAARVALFAGIAWLGIGADAERGTLLSSFAQEVVRLRELLAISPGPVLFLVDEFARTTTPHEGTALLTALLEELRRRGSVALIATHLPGIARAASVPHFAVRGLRDVPHAPAGGDVDGALRALAGSMDYGIAEVTADEPARGDAVALAELLGLDARIIADARKALQASVEGP